MEKVMLQTLDDVIEQDNINDLARQEIKSILKISKSYRAVQIIKKHIKEVPYKAIKRIIDLCAGIVGMIFLIPILIVVKIVYLINGDKAPVLYKQKRVGKNGKIIKIWKIRSMVYNADEVLKELLKNEDYRYEWSKYQKFEKDPRITKIGKILRKTSLDELPQFINVFKGDMSLIGPRPLVDGELESHNGNHSIYERVRPGMSGWWACNGRSALTYDERLNLEYYYCLNCNLLLDIKCVIKTIGAVLFKEGAK